jgi:hypothetical protein
MSMRWQLAIHAITFAVPIVSQRRVASSASREDVDARASLGISSPRACPRPPRIRRR